MPTGGATPNTGVPMPIRFHRAILTPMYPHHRRSTYALADSRASPPRTSLTTDVLVTQALARLEPQLTALTPLLPQALGAQTFLPVLHRLVALGDLPAAPPPYDQPCGLLRQSLDSAHQALTALTQSRLWWAYAPELVQRHRTEGHWRLGAALAGLLHASDTVFDVTVTLPGVPPWNPLQASLLSWLLTHQTQGTLPDQPWPGTPRVAAVMDAGDRTPAHASESRPPAPAGDPCAVGVSRDTSDPTNLFHQLLAPPPVPVSPTAVRLSDTRLVTQDLTMLAQCCQDGTLGVNQIPGQIFVHDDVTLVVVPAALTLVRQRLALTGVRLPGNTAIFNALAATGVVLGPPGHNVVHAVVPCAADRRSRSPCCACRTRMCGARPHHRPIAGHSSSRCRLRQLLSPSWHRLPEPCRNC